MGNPETRIQSAIISNVLRPLEQLGQLWYMRNNTGRLRRVSFGKRGSADLVIAYRGRSIHAEVKVPGKSAEVDQVKELEKHRRAGGYSCVVRSVDDMRAHLDAVKRGEASPTREQWLARDMPPRRRGASFKGG